MLTGHRVFLSLFSDTSILSITSGRAVIILMKRSVAKICCVITISRLHYPIVCAALTLHQSRSCPLAEFRGMGVTSLSTPTPPAMMYNDDDDDNCRIPKLEEEEEQQRIILYVGTKRGKLKQVDWTNRINGQLLDTVSVRDIIMTSNENHETRPDKIGKGVAIHQEDFVFKPYPIYSMAIRMSPRYASARNDGDYFGGNKSPCEIMFSGGADRFVTVLEKEKMDDSDKWTIVQRLGPHTGWVKDIVYCTTKFPSDSVLLFSIGCNCIEVWKMEETSQRSMFCHWKKLTIESSVAMGCTLSSDLLCLGIYKGEYLFAAGVDGRVHLWKICESLQKADVLAAHDGRVNAMFVCELLGVLITVGNDGKVSCLEISPLQLQLWRTCYLDLCEILGYGIKVTSLTVIDEDTSKTIVALGTASGLVVLAKVCYAYDEEETSKISITFLGADCMLDVGADCTVYALESLERIPCLEGTKYCVAVGHQNGMHVWEFVLKENLIQV